MIYRLNPVSYTHLDVYKRQAEYKDENVIPFVDLKDLPPMDYIFQDETTSVRKGINQIMKKQKLEIIPKMVVTSSTPVSYTHLDVYKRQNCMSGK